LIILCPFEDNENIEKKLLEKHLKSCPKAREINEMKAKPFYSERINFFNKEKIVVEEDQAALHSFDEEA
jgi:predicted anti-sigma-YlaC factor YlaD